MKKKKIILLRSQVFFAAAQYYARGFAALDEVELIDIPIDPNVAQPHRDFPPADLLLVVDSGLPVRYPGLEAFSGAKGFISIDSQHKLDIHQEYVARYGFDLIWVSQKHIVAEFGPNCRWLPMGADADIHCFRPQMAASDTLWRRLRYRSHYDIGMCGARYPHRQAFEKSFRRAGLSVNFHYKDKFLEEATRETARCTIGFNVAAGYVPNPRKFIGKDVNMRIFENMANGQAMLLTNTWEGLGYEDLFDEGVHYIGYATDDEAMEKGRHFCARPEEAARIARAGQAHILAGHTYRHRCQEIVDLIRGTPAP